MIIENTVHYSKQIYRFYHQLTQSRDIPQVHDETTLWTFVKFFQKILFVVYILYKYIYIYKWIFTCNDVLHWKNATLTWFKMTSSTQKHLNTFSCLTEVSEDYLLRIWVTVHHVMNTCNYIIWLTETWQIFEKFFMKLHLFNQKYSKNYNTVKLLFKIPVFYLIPEVANATLTWFLHLTHLDSRCS